MTWLVAVALVLFAFVVPVAATDFNRETGHEYSESAWTVGHCLCATSANDASMQLVTSLGKKSFWVSAGGLSPDMTHCSSPSRLQVNSGPRLWVLTCADNDGSEAHFNVGMPDGWDGGTITIELQALSVNASPADALDVDFSCQCRGDGDLLDNTWGTAKNAVVTFNGAQYDEEHATTAALTPNGTCAGGDSLYCRMVVDATNTTAAMADVRILGVKVEYTRGDQD